MPLKPARSLIVYGNCQGDAITSTLQADPIVPRLFDVAYCRSFDHPVEGQMLFDEQIARACALLWEQHDPLQFPKADALPADALRLRFPATDCNLFWPFHCVNKYDRPEPPVYPFGRFPYGDRVIIAAIDRGMSAEEILDYYLNGWDDYKIDLDRLFELETARMKARDTRCDVKIADYVLKHLRTQRLFLTTNHPTSILLAELIERLLHASDSVQPALQDADIAETLAANFPATGPLSVVGVPIHPRIAEHFGLEWYNRNELYRSWSGRAYSYVEYFEEMIRHALRIREEGTAAPTPAR